MAKVWVLHTETKGTGATMVPLESVTKRPSEVEPVFVPPKPPPRPEQQPNPRTPRRFKVVDVLTNEVLVEDVGARDALDALRDAGSIVEVNIFVWNDERERWRMLTFGERRAMWELGRS